MEDNGKVNDVYLLLLLSVSCSSEAGRFAACQSTPTLYFLELSLQSRHALLLLSVEDTTCL